MRTRTSLGLLAAAGLLVALSSAITYAAATTSGKTVTACRAVHGRLALQSANGRCPRGFHKITLNQRGPTGPRGAIGRTGRTGARGPAGPGAVSFTATSSDTSDTVEATPVNFATAGIRVAASCRGNSATDIYLIDQTGVGGAIDVEGMLQVVAAPGASGGVYHGSTQDQPITAPGSVPVSETVDGGQNDLARIELTSGGSSVLLIARRGQHTVALTGMLWQSPFGCQVQLQAVPSV